MENSSKNVVMQTVKILLVTSIKLIALGVIFLCRITALILTKISETLEKIINHGSNH